MAAAAAAGAAVGSKGISLVPHYTIVAVIAMYTATTVIKL
jgi:hypothetical protein